MNERPQRLLLVEDEAVTATVVKHQLERLGYAVDHVITGEAAVASVLYEGSRPDIILMDVELGAEIDGTEAARQILNEIDIPIVFLSGFAHPEIFEKLQGITFYGYVVKNSDISVLDTTIKIAMKSFCISAKERDYYENAPCGYHSLDKDGIFVRMNNTELSWLGYSRKEIVGKKKLSDIITIDSLEVYERSFPAFKERGWVHGLELEMLRKDGTVLPALLNATAMKDSAGNYLMSRSTVFDITERKRYEEEIKWQLAKKETLLREVYHRIKNNIAQIEGLLSLQAGSTDSAEVKAQLNKATSRLQSTRILYESLLLKEDSEEVLMKNYLDTLIDTLVDVFNDNPSVTTEKNIVDFPLSSKKAVLIGMILNELLTNVFKYAFNGNDEGHVSINLEKADTQVTLTVQDDGVGLDEKAGENTTQSLGFTLVRMLVEELEGTFTVENHNGTKCVVTSEV